MVHMRNEDAQSYSNLQVGCILAACMAYAYCLLLPYILHLILREVPVHPCSQYMSATFHMDNRLAKSRQCIVPLEQKPAC